MKKVLIVSAVFPPEQVTSALLNMDLASELSKTYDVTVIRPFPTRPIGTVFTDHMIGNVSFENILVDSYTNPKSSLLGRFFESVDFGRKAANYIRKNHSNIDFIYNDAWQLFGLFLVAKVAKKYNIPYIVPIQDIYPECLFTKSRYPGFVQKMITSVLKPIDAYYQRNAYKVRTISEEMANYLSSTRKIDRNKYLVVNNWQNDEDFLNVSHASNHDNVVFAYVGSINVHANVDLMIRAFAEAEIPNSEFRIYGGGNQKEYCQTLVKELGVSNVSFGFVSRDQIPSVQAEADILVLALPTGNGNLCLPSKLTSYLLSGKPVVASVDSDSSTRRIIEGQKCGITVKPDCQQELVTAFRSIASKSKSELSDMGNRSIQYARAHLTRDVNLMLVVNEINKLSR